MKYGNRCEASRSEGPGTLRLVTGSLLWGPGSREMSPMAIHWPGKDLRLLSTSRAFVRAERCPSWRGTPTAATVCPGTGQGPRVQLSSEPYCTALLFEIVQCLFVSYILVFPRKKIVEECSLFKEIKAAWGCGILDPKRSQSLHGVPHTAAVPL